MMPIPKSPSIPLPMSSKKISEQILQCPETPPCRYPHSPCSSLALHHQKGHLWPHLDQILIQPLCHLYNCPSMAVAGSFFHSWYCSLEKIKRVEECPEQWWLLLSALAVCQDLATCLEEVKLASKFRCLCSLTASLLQNSSTHKRWIISVFIHYDLHERQRCLTRKATMTKKERTF